MAKTEQDVKKNKTIAATVDPELFEKIDAYRWPNRMRVSDVVKEALTEWANARGL